MDIKQQKMSCKPCPVCNGTKWESTMLRGRRFNSKSECEQAEQSESTPKPKKVASKNISPTKKLGS